MAQNEPSRRTHHPAEIPDKLYFRIGDVARLCNVPAYVLRFWETEFPQLKPNKGGTGQRLYRRRDVEIAMRIKRLVHVEGYTIPGARSVLKTEQFTAREPQMALSIEPPPGSSGTRSSREPGTELPNQPLLRLRRELQELHALLSRPPGAPAPLMPRPKRVIRRQGTGPRLALAPDAARPGTRELPDPLHTMPRNVLFDQDPPG